MLHYCDSHIADETGNHLVELAQGGVKNCSVVRVRILSFGVRGGTGYGEQAVPRLWRAGSAVYRADTRRGRRTERSRRPDRRDRAPDPQSPDRAAAPQERTRGGETADPPIARRDAARQGRG